MNFFDSGILDFMHILAIYFGGLLTPIFKFLWIFFDNGIPFIILGVILVLFKKTRWLGICLLISIFIGGVASNLIVKNIVKRVRPFLSEIESFKSYWEFIGAPLEHNYSFPSGHCTVVTDSMLSITYMCKKKYKKMWFKITIILVIIVAISRMYLMHHYPTDCLVGILFGIIASFFGLFFTKFLQRYLLHRTDDISKFIIDFDIVKFIKR